MALPILLIASLALVAATTAPTPKSNMLTHSKEQDIRIINGQDAEVGQFPHQAFVHVNDDTACGGSLISKDSVLTAAHCALTSKKFTIRLGGIYWNENEDTAWIIVSTQARTHPDYNENGHWNNDVAVIFLPQEAPLGSYIKLVALPSFLELDETFEGHKAQIAGWGWTSADSGCSKILKWTEMSVISNSMCQPIYMPGVVIESTLCASSVDTTTCQGDSGTALVINTPGGYKQIGVLNFGPPNCPTGVPVGFARVTFYLQWITETAGMSAQ